MESTMHKPEADTGVDTLEAAGMWVFLATEVMFFGGLFTAYAVYTYVLGEGFAQTSRKMHVVLGTINTVVLVTSSFTMALAVGAAEDRRKKALLRLLGLTALLGAVFVGIKLYEWYLEYCDRLVPGIAYRADAPRGEAMFLVLYFIMTGLHAVHLTIGIILVVTLCGLIWTKRLKNMRIVDVIGLYWHFVDLIWIFLFPIIYLVQRWR